MKHDTANTPHTAALMILAALLSACGGGGGASNSAPTASGPAPAAALLTLTPQAIKTLRFSWGNANGATQYRLLESTDGQSDYVEVGDPLPAGTTQIDHEVFLPERFSARYTLQACNDAGCTNSQAVSVTDTLSDAVGFLKVSNADEGDQLGQRIALSADGRTLAVGASFEDSSSQSPDDNAADNSGAVYVFTRVAGGWQQQGYLKAASPVEEQQFGSSVALAADGLTLAVGATGENGSVHVFTRGDADSDWLAPTTLVSPEAAPPSLFGVGVALSADGQTLAVGTMGADGNSGAVHVYTRNGSNWQHASRLQAANGEAGDLFGRSVSLSADGLALAVGADSEDGDGSSPGNNGASASGAAYVFTRSAGANDWSQQAYLKASQGQSLDMFGHSVVLSADGLVLAVGATHEDGNGTDPLNDDVDASGAVYVFTRIAGAGNWSQTAYLKADPPGAQHLFGVSVALSGPAEARILAVGANGTASKTGAVHLYRGSGGQWARLATVAPPHGDAFDLFGTSVAITTEGPVPVLAVGAMGEASAARTIGGDQQDDGRLMSGAVYLY